MKVYSLTTEGDNCPMETRVFATEAEAFAALRTMLDSPDRIPDDQLTEVWSQEMDGPACIESHEIIEPSRADMWELIGAINWIVESWSKRELSDAVNNAQQLAEEIAIKYPL